MNILKSIIFLLFFGNINYASTKINSCDADLVIFSYDRPLQLYAYLESLKNYVSGLKNIFVLYRTSNQEFEKAYQDIQKEYQKCVDIKFFKQNNQTAPHNFKPLLLKILFTESKSNYILFGVDDIIVTNFININNCITLMIQEKAFGFYLRLGKNITKFYVQSVDFHTTPQFKIVTPDVLAWKFKDGKYAWKHATSVDMTVVHKQEIECFKTIEYQTPNQLEIAWSNNKRKETRNKTGLCYAHSKMVNIPFNIVQEDKTQNNMGIFSTIDLLGLYNKNLKLDINALFAVNNQAPHIEYIPTFVSRL